VSTSTGPRMVFDPYFHLLHDPQLHPPIVEEKRHRSLPSRVLGGIGTAAAAPFRLGAEGARLAGIGVVTPGGPFARTEAVLDASLGRVTRTQRANETSIGFGMRQIAGTLHDANAAREFGSAIGLSEQTMAEFPNRPLSLGTVLRWKVADDLGVDPDTIPDPDQWEWHPVAWGNPSVQRSLQVHPGRGGGLPMVAKIPGFDENFEFFDNNNNNVVTFSWAKVPTPTAEPTMALRGIIPHGEDANMRRLQESMAGGEGRFFGFDELAFPDSQ
jgi:hypothetical protein